MGWELFSQYVRALKEAKPKYFIYENNKSMSKAIRASIDKAFGFEAVLINSALVSAQNRQRLYWVGRRNEDGTYSKVNVEQPADRGILLKDVLDNAVAMREKAHAVIASAGRTTEREFFTKNQGNMVAEPINCTVDGKAKTISASYAYKGDGEGSLKSELFPDNPIKQTSNYVAEPVCMRYERSEEAKACRKAYEAHEVKHGYHELHELHPRTDGKTNTLTSVEKDNRVAEPVLDICQVGAMPKPDGELSTSAGFRVYSVEAKGRYLCANGGGAGAKTGLYAIPYAIEFDDDSRPIKAIGKDGKEITIYEVKDGKITIKGKQYPIKLKDGYYIICKLTVSECKRLQTVPEWYEFPVSNSQAYKMLGNGWTCEVICHLVNSCFKPADVLPGQIGLWG